ncbi:MAG: hypothetical protein K2X48_04215 [Chitinophagaceae bacterium]|nr:hypothetical protein [Chitinophagaceae bacterium]
MKENNSEMQIVYHVSRDKEGDVLLGINYEKIKLFTKSGNEETEMDADNASFSVNATEKLLGALKESRIDVVLKPNGILKSVNGFNELTEKVFSRISFPDAATKSFSREVWNKTIESGLVKQNIDQFFRIFPDSTVQLHQKWQVESNQSGEVGLKIKTTYFLKAITNEYVYIDANSQIVSDSSGNNMNHFNVSSQLKGDQSGEYVLEIRTGMLVSAKLSSSITGNVIARNTEVPVKIKSKVLIERMKN